MGAPRGLGGKDARVTAFGPDDAGFRTALAERLADHDDGILAAYLESGGAIGYGRLRKALARQTRRALVHPVYFGSAITGAGLEPLIQGLCDLAPTGRRDPDAPRSGAVFKVERGPVGEKIAYVRMFAGTLRTRDRLDIRGVEQRVTAIRAFDRGPAVQSPGLTAGQIGKLWGLHDVRIGDTVGDPPPATARRHFAPPTLETLVVPNRPGERGALLAALAQLAEQDPLINLRQDDIRQEVVLSL
jgi:ribosomal protection tetracycline resistance protein